MQWKELQGEDIPFTAPHTAVLAAEVECRFRTRRDGTRTSPGVRRLDEQRYEQYYMYLLAMDA